MKDNEGYGLGQFRSIYSAFTWREWGKLW